MTIGKWFRAALVSTAVGLLLAAAGHAAEEKLYINGIDPYFPPFSFVDRSGVPDGFDVKALDWIAREMKFRVRHQPVNWDEVIPSLKEGKIDIVASGLSITDPRKEQVSFTVPYWKFRQVLVVRKEAKLTQETALADGNRIGVQRGTAEAKWIEENLIRKKGAKIELVLFDTATLALEEVVGGRVAAAAVDITPALDAVKKKPVRILGGFGMDDEEFGYAVRKEDPELLKKLNEGLRRLMKSPYWDELKKRYIER